MLEFSTRLKRGHKSNHSYIENLVWYLLGSTVTSHLIGGRVNLQKVLFLLSLAKGFFLSLSDTRHKSVLFLAPPPEDSPVIYIGAQCCLLALLLVLRVGIWLCFLSGRCTQLLLTPQGAGVSFPIQLYIYANIRGRSPWIKFLVSLRTCISNPTPFLQLTGSPWFFFPGCFCVGRHAV